MTNRWRSWKSFAQVRQLQSSRNLVSLLILVLDEFQDFSLFQWMGETPQRLVKDHLFQHDPKSGEKFVKAIEGAKKDVIKDQYEKSPGLQGKEDL